ncbi:hypothetical protein L228DRAFT_235886 [Xylona heveae TC161]|uniref:Serine-threonine protein kinase 19 n=1 Tax=Xylona heveae (strain CBS 132557 / TC161) TaxID=1328760 RepID=A0A165K1A0_XYLHT|nr:hypothetical protein L228DRAFT_235886 [Xylona heveae TC161]KZF26878.1 hypothetical protein L228DRAFT_235886 [Xylona heveae TC161]
MAVPVRRNIIDCYTAAHSSRITKPRSANSVLKKSTSFSLSSPFAKHPRRKPLSRSKSKPESVGGDDEESDEHLTDLGLVECLATDLSLRDVSQAIKYINSHMFDKLPERAGVNSTRIAEVLNYRRSLPPIVSAAHVHALINSPTSTEKEISHLLRSGFIRKIVVPERAVGGNGLGEGLVLAEAWDKMIQDSSEIGEPLKQRFLSLLHQNPTSITVLRSALSPQDATLLMRAGFLTASSQPWTSTDVYSRPGAASLGTLASLSSVGAKAASGTLDAVGGPDAIQEGGGGGIRRGTLPTGQRDQNAGGDRYSVSLPSTGPYLRLVSDARAHFMSLLAKSKYREAPVSLLRDRWEGGLFADDPSSRAKRARGENTGVLPGRTRKWKQLYGLNFDWTLEECLGAGLIEIFETGSVGRGVRAT